MATNDYTSRSKKDVSIQQLEHPRPTSTIVSPQYTTNTLQLDIDDCIKKYRAEIKKITILKPIALYVGASIVFLALCIFIPSPIVLILEIMSCTLTNLYFKYKYQKLVENIGKNMGIIKSYNKKTNIHNVWKKIMYFPGYVGECKNEDETKIEIDDCVVSASKFKINTHIASRRTIKDLYYGDYFVATQNDKSLGEKIMLVHGGNENMWRIKYAFDCKGFKIFANSESNIDNADMERIYAIGEKILQSMLGNTNNNFILYFENRIIYCIIQTKNVDRFNLNTFNFSIEKKLRRDLNELNYRIKIAEILASA